MKASALTLEIFFLSLVFLEAGCESAPKAVGPSFDASICADYMPAKVDIIPLTEFVSGGNEHEATKISVYVSLLDSFGSQKKAPGVFRFELYKKAVNEAVRFKNNILIEAPKKTTKKKSPKKKVSKKKVAKKKGSKNGKNKSTI